jgi:hypothetical protein
VGIHDDQQGSAKPIQAVDEERGELASSCVLEQAPAFWPLVQRDRTRNAVVGVCVCYLIPVEAAELLEEVPLDL